MFKGKLQALYAVPDFGPLEQYPWAEGVNIPLWRKYKILTSLFWVETKYGSLHGRRGAGRQLKRLIRQPGLYYMRRSWMR